jgi:hypothetical protein
MHAADLHGATVGTDDSMVLRPVLLPSGVPLVRSQSVWWYGNAAKEEVDTRTAGPALRTGPAVVCQSFLTANDSIMGLKFSPFTFCCSLGIPSYITLRGYRVLPVLPG